MAIENYLASITNFLKKNGPESLYVNVQGTTIKTKNQSKQKLYFK